MRRYFFDIVRDSGVDHDYRGVETSNPGFLRDHAENIAMDLLCSYNNNNGRAVRVLDALGHLVFEVPVQENLRSTA